MRERNRLTGIPRVPRPVQASAADPFPVPRRPDGGDRVVRSLAARHRAPRRRAASSCPDAWTWAFPAPGGGL
ncbi:hypothetical protein GCM10017559_84800 [Streptosporangium longisporum]|uniref:Uncharacterized protein n=1 Tax=Streptosporangium longisporum TaxID=46187 RepID=A0ABP6LKM4_9ACTN